MPEIKQIREQLLEKQKELAQRIDSTQEEERSDTTNDSVDWAQKYEDADIRDGLDDEAATELEQVNEALARLDAGEYGYCKACGNPIGEARLEALPYATLCIDDAEVAEEQEGRGEY